MSGVDWAALFGGASTGKEPVTTDSHSPLLRMDAMPPVVRDLLMDPTRPRITAARDIGRWSDLIMAQWPEYQRWRAGASNDAEIAWGLDYSRRELLRLGYAPGKVDAQGNDWRWFTYFGGVEQTVLHWLRSEMEERVVEMAAKSGSMAAATRDDALLANVPSDGDGIGYNDLAALWGKSRRTSETIAARLVKDGFLRVEEVAGEHGGRARKAFWRVADLTVAEDES